MQWSRSRSVQPLAAVGNSRGCRSEEDLAKDGQIMTKPVSLSAFLGNNSEMPHENRNSPRLYPDLIWLAILNSIGPLLWTICFDFWQRDLLPEKKAKTPKPLKPKTPEDCAMCREAKALPPKEVQPCQMPCPWSAVRNRRGRQKSISTQGYASNNRKCVYFHIMDEKVHALVGRKYKNL